MIKIPGKLKTIRQSAFEAFPKAVSYIGTILENFARNTDIERAGSATGTDVGSHIQESQKSFQWHDDKSQPDAIGFDSSLGIMAHHD
jgi:hypothetical protein